jgi:peroxiredoxin
MLNFLSGIGSSIMFWHSNWNPVWISPFLATFPLPFYLLVISKVFSLARTSKNLTFFQFTSIIAVILAAYICYIHQSHSHTLDYIPFGLTLLGAISYQWYIRIFSLYNRKKSEKLLKGQSLPDLHLQRLDGTTINSSTFKGSKTLLIFFRANWCPFCVNQLKEIINRAPQLNNAGVQVKFISNQGIKNSKRLFESLNLPENFELLQDEDLQTAKKLGIEDIGGTPSGIPGYPADTVMATVIALDAKSKVIFGDETDNYRARPYPDTFLHVFN